LKGEKMFKHELGKEVCTKVAGLKGIITSRSECLYGCNRYYIEPKVDKEGRKADGWWVDEDDVQIIGDGVTQTKKNTGGPMDRTH
jgi:hypothetical protein